MQFSLVTRVSEWCEWRAGSAASHGLPLRPKRETNPRPQLVWLAAGRSSMGPRLHSLDTPREFDEGRGGKDGSNQMRACVARADRGREVTSGEWCGGITRRSAIVTVADGSVIIDRRTRPTLTRLLAMNFALTDSLALQATHIATHTLTPHPHLRPSRAPRPRRRLCCSHGPWPTGLHTKCCRCVCRRAAPAHPGPPLLPHTQLHTRTRSTNERSCQTTAAPLPFPLPRTVAILSCVS